MGEQHPDIIDQNLERILHAAGSSLRHYMPSSKEKLREAMQQIAAEDRATIEALVEALEFYADPKRYEGPNQRAVENDPYARLDDAYLRDVTRDGGDIARCALQLARGEKGDE